MNRVYGSIAAMVASALALGMASHANAATAISVGATGNPDHPVTALNNWQYTHNFWPSASDGAVTSVQVVNYPASIGVPPFESMDSSIAKGATGLNDKLNSTPGKKVVICESQGCESVTVLLLSYEKDPSSAPNLDDVVFVFAGNPSAPTGATGKDKGFYNPLLQVTYPGATPTWVKGYMFTKEFDFFAYTPNQVTNPVVVANWLASFVTVHPSYNTVDPNNLPAGTWVKTDGNMTYYVVPAKVAPLLIPTEAGFRALGLGAVFDALNKEMLKTIRPAYQGNLDGYTQIGSTSSADPASVPPVAEQTSTVTLSLSQKPADEKKPAPTLNPVSANQPTPGQTKQDETPKQDPPKVTNDDVKVNPSSTPEVTKADQQPSSDTPPAAEAPKPKQDPELPKVPAAKKPKPTKDSKASKDADDSDAASGPKGETPKASSDAGPKAKSNDADGAMKPKPKPVRVKPGSKDSDKGGASASSSSPSSAPKHETASHGAGGKKSSD